MPKFSPSECLNRTSLSFWTRSWGFPQASGLAGPAGASRRPSGPEQTAADPGRPGSPSPSPCPPPRSPLPSGDRSPPLASLRAGGTLVRARPRFPGRRIRRRDAGSSGRPRSALSLFIHPAVSMAPQPSSAPFPAHSPAAGATGPVGAAGGVRGAGTGRRSPVLPPGRPGHFCSPGPAPGPLACTPICSPPGLSPGPQAQRSPRPGRRRGGGARRRQSC